MTSKALVVSSELSWARLNVHVPVWRKEAAWKIAVSMRLPIYGHDLGVSSKFNMAMSCVSCLDAVFRWY